jgi:hypothetical protein
MVPLKHSHEPILKCDVRIKKSVFTVLLLAGDGNNSLHGILKLSVALVFHVHFKRVDEKHAWLSHVSLIKLG